MRFTENPGDPKMIQRDCKKNGNMSASSHPQVMINHIERMLSGDCYCDTLNASPAAPTHIRVCGVPFQLHTNKIGGTLLELFCTLHVRSSKSY